MPETKNNVVQVRLKPDLKKKLDDVSEATGLDHASIIRLAIIAELPGLDSIRFRQSVRRAYAGGHLLNGSST